jgi:4-hydroxybenzoate polyprenyltransferase
VSPAPGPSAVADLVRLPSVLTAPGDVLLGAALAGEPPGSRATALAAGSSCLLYLAGMALNDYADREVDALERPSRPIPSGRVDAGFALALAVALSAGSLVLAAAAGRRHLALAVPLVATVWTYDLAAKDGPGGPLAMAGARAIDVLLGAGAGRVRPALPGAGVVAAHTLVLMAVSRREVAGAGPRLGRAALAATAAVTAAAATLAGRRLAERRPAAGRLTEPPPSAGRLTERPPAAGRLTGGRPSGGRLGRAVATAGLLGAYAATLGRAERDAARDPSPARLQRLVGTGVLGLMPLEAGLLASAGALPGAAALTGGWALARGLARRRGVT